MPSRFEISFKISHGQLSLDLESAIIPTTYIGGQQFQVLQAKKQLADRSNEQNLINQRDFGHQEATNLKKKNDTLMNAPTSIDQEINWTKAKERQLLTELEDV